MWNYARPRTYLDQPRFQIKLLRFCSRCHSVLHSNSPSCYHCGSKDVEWFEVWWIFDSPETFHRSAAAYLN